MFRPLSISRCAAALLAAALIPTAASSAPAPAVVGQPAPDFALPDVQGKTLKLADFAGKYVVLEWTNPDCPFVRKHYNSGNMPALQVDAKGKDVVWLSITSTNPQSSEYKAPAELQRWMDGKKAQPQAILFDRAGTTGHAYGAKATPHMYVIDPQGRLVYMGAIDDKRSINPDDVKTAKNYVRAALDEALAGRPVSVASTVAYGCSIKY